MRQVSETAGDSKPRRAAKQRAAQARKAAIELALSFPEAWQDEPWEDDVVIKVRKKIFLFAGSEADDDRWPIGIGVKLPISKDEALALPGVTPSGYGLGKWGWVSIPLDQGLLDPELIRDWIEESYRAIAPKTLAAKLAPPTGDEAPRSGDQAPPSRH